MLLVSVITHTEQQLHAAADPESPVHAEAAEQVARHAHLSGGYLDEATARDRFITDIQRSLSLSQDRSFELDDGLEL